MRKLILSMLAAATALVPVAASAQSAAEVRHSRTEVRRDARDLQQARRHGNRHDVREARHELNQSRREYREDWRDYRRTHRDVYRRPAYQAPRGHAYRPIAAGHRFAPAYYGQRYWISDPWRYRLPPAAGYQRWVRHYDDVLLVDVRRGTVLRVIRGFYW
jgi:Ni/Co efflux regulator RcnB